jgi:hypothetical protein
MLACAQNAAAALFASSQHLVSAGFSMLTNLGYETAVPEQQVEIVASLVAQNVRTCCELLPHPTANATMRIDGCQDVSHA